MYRQALRRYHSHQVRGRTFNVGDLVLRLIHSNKNRHKLSPPWDGPYVIAEVLQPGTYKLKTIDGEVFVNAWNIEQLHRFYPEYTHTFSYQFQTPRSFMTPDPSSGEGSALTRGLIRAYLSGK